MSPLKVCVASLMFDAILFATMTTTKNNQAIIGKISWILDMGGTYHVLDSNYTSEVYL